VQAVGVDGGGVGPMQSLRHDLGPLQLLGRQAIDLRAGGREGGKAGGRETKGSTRDAVRDDSAGTANQNVAKGRRQDK
jgi:hypothetical protein